jgi:hypothetical protein
MFAIGTERPSFQKTLPLLQPIDDATQKRTNHGAEDKDYDGKE